jgi:hypothetical protein
MSMVRTRNFKRVFVIKKGKQPLNMEEIDVRVSVRGING